MGRGVRYQTSSNFPTPGRLLERLHVHHAHADQLHVPAGLPVGALHRSRRHPPCHRHHIGVRRQRPQRQRPRVKQGSPSGAGVGRGVVL